MNTTTDDSIRKLLYVTDDVVIANFLGIKPERVADVRAKKPPERPISTYTAPGSAGPEFGNEQTLRTLQTADCKSHLKALLRYGFRNNRDLGMGRDKFLTLAAELGVSA